MARQLLPANVKPVQYDLTFEPLFDSFKFNGDETIELYVNEDSNYVTLHVFEIELEHVTLSIGDSTLKPEKTTTNEDDQTVTFQFERILKKGETVHLHLTFVGLLNNDMAGFYRSKYKEDGVEKYLATTQMQPADCRRAFPCFDEPNLKARFAIALIADKALTCLSNMDVKKEEEVDATRKKVVFNTTPKMSTYLVAYMVGDLRHIESHDKFGSVPIRVYATPGNEQGGFYAADLAVRALQYYENSFGIPYPLPKMDFVAVPDFLGAMENWGLVIGSNNSLLYDPAKSTLNARQSISNTVAHELAHQWFGNYCTLDFWDSLWLNESFATYMAWKCSDDFFPEWKSWDHFVEDSLQGALTLDGLRSSHPIELLVERSSEVDDLFDAISYGKGSAVVRMLVSWLGEETFIKGVSQYLKQHAYGNATTAALWESLSAVSGKDVKKTMTPWTEKVGYPVVTVSESSEGKVSLTQHRFLATGDVKIEEDETIYPVFVRVKNKKGTVDESIVLADRTKTLEIDSKSFLKINADSAGLFRANYTPERWALLGNSAAQLSVGDRIGLVADAGALAVPGLSTTTSLLSLVAGWKNESSVFVWEEILKQLAAVRAAWLFEDETLKTALIAFTQDLVSEKTHAVGWEFDSETSFLDQRLKALLFGAALENGDKKIGDVAKKMFAEYVAGNKNAINPNLKTSIFNYIAATGGEKEFGQLLAVFENSDSREDTLAALRSLGRFRDPAILTKVFALLLEGKVRAYDICRGMQGMRSHKKGVEMLFTWMCTNWDRFVAVVPSGWGMLGTAIQICTASFTKKEQCAQVEEFFKVKDTKGYANDLSQALETIQNKVGWVERDGEEVGKWLKERKYL